MNLAISLLLAWAFAYLEDDWFNRLLRYQLTGNIRARDLFNATVPKRSWILLGGGLTLIIVSFPHQFSVSIFGASFAAGVTICLLYIALKLKCYNQAARATEGI